MASNCNVKPDVSVLPSFEWFGRKLESTYAKSLEEVLGLGVDVELAALRVLGEVERGDLGDVLILALALLLLKLEGDAADGTTLDTLHKMRRVAGNLVNSQVRISPNLEGQQGSPRFGMLTLLRSLFEEMMAISSHMRLLVSKSRVSLG